jgi:hypothetical protein
MVLFLAEKNAVYIGQLPVERDVEHGVLSGGRRILRACGWCISPSSEGMLHSKECCTRRTVLFLVDKNAVYCWQFSGRERCCNC